MASHQTSSSEGSSARKGEALAKVFDESAYKRARMDSIDPFFSWKVDELPNWIPGEREKPCVAVFHVTPSGPGPGFYDFKPLIPRHITRRKETIFYFQPASLLLGNLEESIRIQAMLLLKGLKDHNDNCLLESNRSVIFVAYGLGSLIVKKALSLAATSETEPNFSRAFFNTSLVLFSGCPQRSTDIQTLESKVYALFDKYKKEQWAHLLTSTSVRSLANSILETTDLFIASKISLRSRVISLYANPEGDGHIHLELDFFTATLGIASEPAIQEQRGKAMPKGEYAWREFFHITSFQLESYVSHRHMRWIPRKEWKPTERLLLSLASPHRQLPAKDPGSLPVSVLRAPAYQEWVDVMSPQILYLYGTSSYESHDAADQIFLSWKEEQQKQGIHFPNVFSFTFNAAEPDRDSIQDMLASFFAQAFAGHVDWALDNENDKNDKDKIHQHQLLDNIGWSDILHDQFLFKVEWTAESCLDALESLRRFISEPSTLILLHDLDECSQQSRELFLDYFKKLSERTEQPLRILVTSRVSGSLLDELSAWPSIDMGERDSDAIQEATKASKKDNDPEFKIEDENSLRAVTDSLSLLNLSGSQKKLELMDRTSSKVIIDLIRNHTGWSDNSSDESVTHFSDLLGSSSHTSLDVLDKFLRSIADDEEELCLILGCSLYGLRPLSMELLTSILHIFRKQQIGVEDPHILGFFQKDVHLSESPEDINPSWTTTSHQLASWLRGMADFPYGHVTIKNEIQDLFR
ncbi:hypothetical protein F5X99DRAFT_428511 [Biscogniauxia marginata]|nr:hypothetical protein F5X99DRAFT_428511 [Biscogniauxia marginata]